MAHPPYGRRGKSLEAKRSMWQELGTQHRQQGWRGWGKIKPKP